MQNCRMLYAVFTTMVQLWFTFESIWPWLYLTTFDFNTTFGQHEGDFWVLA